MIAIGSNTAEDQRGYARYRVSWKAKVSRTNRQSHVAHMDELSPKGGHMISRFNLTKGEALLIEGNPLINGKITPIKLVAKVVHTHLLPGNQGVGVGFRFVRTNTTVQRLIEALEKR